MVDVRIPLLLVNPRSIVYCLHAPCPCLLECVRYFVYRSVASCFCIRSTDCVCHVLRVLLLQDTAGALAADTLPANVMNADDDLVRLYYPVQFVCNYTALTVHSVIPPMTQPACAPSCNLVATCFCRYRHNYRYWSWCT